MIPLNRKYSEGIKMRKQPKEFELLEIFSLFMGGKVLKDMSRNEP